MKNSEAARILRDMAEQSRKFMAEQPTMIDAHPAMIEQQLACDHAAEKLENMARKGKEQ